MKIGEREKKFLIALAGVVGLLLLYLLLIEPLARGLGRMRKQARDRKTLLVEYQKKAGEKEGLEERLKKLEKEYLKTLVQIKPLRNYLIEEKTVPDFRKSLGRITDANDLGRLTTQALTPKDYGTYQEESAKLSFNASWGKLGKLLYDLETSGELFFVRSLNVSGVSRRGTTTDNLRVNALNFSRFTFSPEVTQKLREIFGPEEYEPGLEEGEPPQKDFVYYAVIEKKDPFLMPDAALPGPGRKPLPMKLSLRGITFREGEYSALIKDTSSGGKEENYFKVGESVTGYRIKEIFSERVVLVKGEEEFELTLYEPEGKIMPELPEFSPPSTLRTAKPNELITALPPEKIKEAVRTVQSELGLITRELDENIAKRFDLPGESGLLVLRVVKGSEADKAGVKRGDVVLRIAGAEVKTKGEALDILTRIDLEQDLAIEVIRDKENKVLTIPSGEIKKKVDTYAR